MVPVVSDPFYRSINISSRSKIVENLAAVGYDTNLLSLAAYDWRLSYYNLEVRDGYFSRLKTTIESFKYSISSCLRNTPNNIDYY
jgi:Lecithin:cholesterol acyltransferase